jgi:hypothetical protein
MLLLSRGSVLDSAAVVSPTPPPTSTDVVIERGHPLTFALSSRSFGSAHGAALRRAVSAETAAVICPDYRKDKLPGLAKRSHSDYQKVLDWMKPLAGMEVSLVTRGFVIRLRDRAYKEHKRRFANYVVSVVQSVLTWAVDREYVDNHDVHQIKPIPRPRGLARANRPWTREEWETVIACAHKHLKAPILLCVVLGWREAK